MRWFFPLLIAAAPAFAETCPAVPDRSAEKAAHYAGLLAATNEQGAAPHNAGLWDIWLDAPDATAQGLLDRGIAARRFGDFLASIAALDRLVDYCPDYAEGYNQRAFTYFLGGRFEQSLADLDRTLAIDPRHIGALSGKGLTLIELGRTDAAQEALKAAVALHPWLTERSLITEAPGTDL
ncbi:tetratricopeptide repeat protein [Yoonia sp.]|uniref:tetratricopeptide repeat protein n=1 Tax=Yoonia sp. TaxID=2212373 RepID=UPI002FDA1BE9